MAANRFAMVLAVLFLTFGGSVNAAPQKTSTAPPASEMHVKNQETHDDELISGKVVETMNAGGYTYVCVAKNGAKTWVAVPEMKVTMGQELTFLPGSPMPNFTSKSLNRTFDSIIFSAGLAPEQKPVGTKKAKAAKTDGMVMTGSAVVASPAESIKVEKASGANSYTVAEIYEKRAKLNKKIVVVKGKVVKVTAGIMGKNWIHVQDGTGDAKKGSHNLVVTMQDKPAVGDTVTVKGTVYKDKDFGSGYNYKVIMEEASVQN